MRYNLARLPSARKTASPVDVALVAKRRFAPVGKPCRSCGAPPGDLPLPSKPLSKKYFRSLPTQITSPFRAVPSHTEGRLAIVTNAGRDAVDADVPITNGTEADGEAVWS
jgi:hypothetical protein